MSPISHMNHTSGQRVIIVAGGTVDPILLQTIQEHDYIIGADRGALTLIQHGYRPDVALGDFDSIIPEELDLIRQASKQIQACDPIDKNYTDTELAFHCALKKNPTSITLLAATGTRLDHTLANIHLLKRALELQVSMQIVDSHNQIQLTDHELIIHDADYTYVSLLPLTTDVSGICLEGFAYPLNNATLTIGQSLGISNKLIEATGTITLSTGILLVIASKD